MKPSIYIAASCLIGCYIAFFLTRDPIGPASIPLSAFEQSLCWLGLTMMIPALPFALLIPIQPAIIPLTVGTILASVIWPFFGRYILSLYRRKTEPCGRANPSQH